MGQVCLSNLLVLLYCVFLLKTLLHVHDITKNLMSDSQFTATNKVFLEFHPDSCFVKNLSTRKTLLRG